MTPRTIMASTSLVFILGLAACAPTPSAPPPPPAAQQPIGASPDSMDNGVLQGDMGAAPISMD